MQRKMIAWDEVPNPPGKLCLYSDPANREALLCIRPLAKHTGGQIPAIYALISDEIAWITLNEVRIDDLVEKLIHLKESFSSWEKDISISE